MIIKVSDVPDGDGVGDVGFRIFNNMIIYVFTSGAFKRLLFIKGIKYVQFHEWDDDPGVSYDINIPTYKEFLKIHKIFKICYKNKKWGYRFEPDRIPNDSSVGKNNFVTEKELLIEIEKWFLKASD